MKHFNTYTGYTKQFEYHEDAELDGEFGGYDDTLEEAIDTLENHLFGSPISQERWEAFEASFDNGKIRAGLQYYGEVYRMIFFKSEAEYQQVLKNGLDTRRHYVFSCTQSLDAVETLREQLQCLHHTHYIIFRLDSNAQTCFTDIQSVCDELGVYNEYEEEQEVLIRSSAVPLLTDVEEHGEVIHKN